MTKKLTFMVEETVNQAGVERNVILTDVLFASGINGDLTSVKRFN